jgi:uncharacterized membrane protein YeaQ/YmgE (transglycosylase-associated protein family)
MLWTLIIGAVAGWAAGQLTQGRGFGIVVNVILGVVGAFVGNFILSLIGFMAYGTLGQLIASIIGAVIVLWAASLFTGSNKPKSN